ncbi:hypothetical protein ABZW67_15460 [Streptomyces rubiginosohelvolus]|uniref:hypothetical protein n=1 Tax=Streptomyces rubiginosohelvolus TaxID=67362 RepID=UPI0033BAEBAE
MPWVKLDDRFPTHRKVALLSDRAFRLYVSGLCWSSENLTEGRILTRELPFIARVRGLKAVAKELEEAGLWDPADGGWTIHDYLEYNPDRAKVQAERKSNAERQKAWRERRKQEKEAARNGDRNGVTEDASSPGNSTTATRRRHDGDTTALRNGSGNPPSSQVNTFRNGVSNAAPSPTPTPVLPTEEPPPYPPQADGHLPAVYGQAPAAAAVGPDWLQPLTAAMGTAGMHVPWKFKGDDLIRLHNDIQRLGVPLMVEQASRSWQSARTPVVSSRFFYDSWHALPTPAPTPDGRPSLRSVTGPSKTTSYLESMAAIADELRAAGGNQ